MFSFMLSILVLTLMFSLIGGAAFLLRGTLLRGREGVMYPFWIILLIITVFPLRIDLAELTEPFVYSEHSDEAIYADEQYHGYAIGESNADNRMSSGREAPIKSENPIVMKLRRIIAASVEYVDEVSAVLFVLWLAGALFNFIGVIVEYIRTLTLMKHNSSACADERIGRMLYKLRRRMNIRRTIRLRIFDLDSLSSPCVGGIIRPTLYIESECLTMSDRELECVLTHELTHIRRFDMLARLFCFFAASVHWFNPTAYRVRRAVLEDCELSCDYSVVKEYGSSVSSLYMGTILNFAERYSDGCRLICREGYGGGLFVSPPSGVSFLRRRYANMKNFKKDRPTLILVIAFTIVAALVNTVVLSSCSGITTQALASAMELTPPVDIMVRAYYDLDTDDYITTEMVDGITTVKVEAKTLSDGQIAATFTVNGDDSFTSPLPMFIQHDYAEGVILPAVKEYSERTNDGKIYERFMAFLCLNDLNAPELTERARREMLLTHPKLEEYGCLYVLDPHATERERSVLISYLDAAEVLDPWVLTSTEFDASSFGYFENLTEIEFVGLTPAGYDFPDDVKVTITETDNKA